MNSLDINTIKFEIFPKLDKHNASSFALVCKQFLNLFNLHVKIERENILKQWKLDPCNAIRRASSERYTDLVLSFIKGASDLILNAGMLGAAERGNKDIVLLLIDYGADAYSEAKNIATDNYLKDLLQEMETEDTIKYETNLTLRGRMRNEKKEGIHKSWYKNGQLNDRNEWKNGIMQGINEGWYENGQLSFRGKWENGVEEGMYEEWHENDQLEYQVEYKKGKEEGVSKRWYDNGQLEYQGEWKNGYEEGIHEHWYKNGQLKDRVVFMYGELHGLEESWHENGQLKGRGEWKNGDQEGVCKVWDKNGLLTYHVEFEDGSAIKVVKDGGGGIQI